jgi:hypothetical protein
MALLPETSYGLGQLKNWNFGLESESGYAHAPKVLYLILARDRMIQ